MIRINRGFTTMIPKPKVKEKIYFNNQIRFRIFSKEFSLAFKIKHV